MRFFLAMLLVAGPGFVWAQQSDLSIAVALPGGGFVPPGEIAEIVVTLSNGGPNTASDVSASTSYTIRDGFLETSIVLVTDQSPPCSVNALDLSGPDFTFVGLSIFPDNRELAPGESVSCRLGISTGPRSPASFQQFFSAATSTSDPNAANDVTSVTIATGNLQGAVQNVPALSSWGVWMLAICIVAVGVLYSRQPLFCNR